MNLKTTIASAACLLVAAITWADVPTTITTTDGQTYNGVSLIRSEPDGFLVNYQPVQNGVGIAKIKFARLSSDQQQQYGYSATAAKDYEAKTVKAGQDAAQASLKWDEAAKAAQTAREARDEREEQANLQRMMTMAQLKATEANGTRSQEVPDYGYGWALGAGGVAIAIPQVGNPQRQPENNAKIFTDRRSPFAELNTSRVKFK